MNILRITVIALITLLAVGCASKAERMAAQEKKIKAQNVRFEQSKSIVEQLNTRMAQAKEDNLDYFDPVAWRKAQENYNDTQEEYGEIVVDRSDATERQTAKIKNYVILTNSALDKAYQSKTNSERILEKSFDIKSVIDKLSAATLFPTIYAELNTRLNAIVKDISLGKTEQATAASNVLASEYSAFEVKVVKQIETKGIKRSLASLTSLGASTKIPNTYRKSRESLTTVEMTIAKDPRNSAAIKESIRAAEFEIERAKVTLAGVNQLEALRDANKEGYVNKLESWFYNISSALGAEDLRNLPIEQQAANIQELAMKLKELSDLQSQQLSALQSTAAQKEQQIQSLAQGVQATEQTLQNQLKSKDLEITKYLDANTSLQATVNQLTTEMAAQRQKGMEVEQKLLALQKKESTLNQQLSSALALLAAKNNPLNGSEVSVAPDATDTDIAEVSEQISEMPAETSSVESAVEVTTPEVADVETPAVEETRVETPTSAPETQQQPAKVDEVDPPAPAESSSVSETESTSASETEQGNEVDPPVSL